MVAAESLTPSQLLGMQTEDRSLYGHALECGACAKWLESQRFLSSALQSLRTLTAQREAGPRVEQSVLQAFRTQGFAPAAVVAPKQAAPGLWRLSRFFEIGAYAAVAAALIVGVFLGSRMLRDKQTAAVPVQARKAAAPQTDNTAASSVGENDEPRKTAPTEIAGNRARSAATRSAEVRTRRSSRAAVLTEAKSTDDAGFVALMLCDPLICSGDEQVIRMELPATGATSAEGDAAQPVIADVVVGDDGLVRAMRIVN